jgi:hypothetical protein
VTQALCNCSRTISTNVTVHPGGQVCHKSCHISAAYDSLATRAAQLPVPPTCIVHPLMTGAQATVHAPSPALTELSWLLAGLLPRWQPLLGPWKTYPVDTSHQEHHQH